MKHLLACSFFAVAFFLGAATAQADSVTFTVVPSATTSVPGSTVGWGYSLTNNTKFLIGAVSLNASSFQSGNMDYLLFDLPLLSPSTSASKTYVPGSSGLAQFTWDTSALPGTANSGFFLIGFDFFDPITFQDSGRHAFDAQAAYSFSVSSPAVPEPASLAFLAVGLGACLLFRRRLASSLR